MSNRSKDAGRANSIGLRAEQLDTVFEEMDEGSGAADARREFVRWAFRQETVHMRVAHPGGAEVVIKVACRNLSRGGLSVLHSAYMHPGTKVTIALKHPTEGLRPHKGVVMRCQHRRGHIHEVGIRFIEPINAREYLGIDPLSDSFSLEQVDPSSLVGCLLHIEDSELDRKIVQHFLRGTQLRIRSADSVEDGIGIAMEGVDIILCDFNLAGDETGDELVTRLRDRNVQTPVIIVTSDTGEATREKMRNAKANGFLSKPFDQSLLLRAVGEFLVVQTDQGATVSSMAEDPDAKPLIAEFVTDLHRYADEMQKSFDQNETDNVRQVCLRIKGTAPSLGFDRIADLADEAIRSLDSSSANDAQVKSLIAACKRAA